MTARRLAFALVGFYAGVLVRRSADAVAPGPGPKWTPAARPWMLHAAHATWRHARA